MSYPAISLATATAGRHRRPQKRLQTPRQPPVYPNSSPEHRACNSLTPLPLSSRLPSVSIGGFGIRRILGLMSFMVWAWPDRVNRNWRPVGRVPVLGLQVPEARLSRECPTCGPGRWSSGAGPLSELVVSVQGPSLPQPLRPPRVTRWASPGDGVRTWEVYAVEFISRMRGWWVSRASSAPVNLPTPKRPSLLRTGERIGGIRSFLPGFTCSRRRIPTR